MKTVKNYLKMALVGIISLSMLSLSIVRASENDTFGENVAKAVLFHWSPKPEHIKTAYTNDSLSYQNQDEEDIDEDNDADNMFED